MKNAKKFIIVITIICLSFLFVLGYVNIKKYTKEKNIENSNISERIIEIAEELSGEFTTGDIFKEIEAESFSEPTTEGVSDYKYTNEEAMVMYMRFLRGEIGYKEKNGGTVFLDDFAMPTKEPNDRYFTSYAFWDCNKDGIKDLVIIYARGYIYLICSNGSLVPWKSGYTQERLYPLNDGGFFSESYAGLDDFYKYCWLDADGNEIYSYNFGIIHKSNKEGTGYDLTYLYNGENISEERYREIANNITNIGDEQIKWFILYTADYDGKKHIGDLREQKGCIHISFN